MAKGTHEYVDDPRNADILRVARDDGIPVVEKSFSLYDVYGADEAFVTGTFAGLVPVREVDGRTIGHPLDTAPDWPRPGPMARRLAKLYGELCAREAQVP